MVCPDSPGQSKQSNVNNGSQKKTTSSPPTPSQASLESKGSPADGGILKSLKDLEWDLSELFSEKVIIFIINDTL